MRTLLLISVILICATACNTFHSNTKNQEAAYTNAELGLAYLQQGDVERAKNKLLLALNQDSHSSIVLDAMAYYLEMTGHLQEADTYYKKAMQVDPQRGGPLNNYGTFLCRKGEYQAAEQYFLTALQDTTYTKMADVYENAGLCAMQAKDYTKAKQFFIKAKMEDPKRKSPPFLTSQLSS